MSSSLGKSMLVSFLVFGQIFTFLVAKYLVSILHIFLAYLKACYPYIIQFLSINKIESFNFSLVL